MKKLVLIIIVSATFFWYGFQGNSIKATTGSTISSDMPQTNFTGADLTGAKLGGANLDGVVLCNTTMPNGTLNMRDCKN